MEIRCAWLGDAASMKRAAIRAIQGASHNRPPKRPQRHEIPTSGMTAESGKRERRDIDPGKGRGAGAERVHNRRSNDRGVGDGQRRAFARQRLREPGANALDQGRDQLAAVRARPQDRRARRRTRPVRAQRHPSKRGRASAHSRSLSAPFRLRRRSPAPRPSRAPRAPARSAPEHRGATGPSRLGGRRRRRPRALRRRGTGPRASPRTRHARAGRGALSRARPPAAQ